ncbi:MAG: hypothetical protein ACI8PZ_002236 [Myxococcota bacterium]|jgi:hypothetical protein
MSDPRPRIAAAVLPVVVLLAAAAALVLPEPAYDDDNPGDAGNAGRVMNGRRLRGDVVKRMEADLRIHQPQVLVVGNSTAHTNIDTQQLASTLGIPPSSILVFSIPNSVTAHWYAVLKNRVFANGYRPRLVVVTAGLQAALAVEPYSAAGRMNLAKQLEPEEPVLDAVIPRQHPSLARFEFNRGLARDGLLDGVRNLAVQWTVGGEAEAAMERVFHHGRLQSDMDGAFIGPDLSGGSALPAPSESLLPALAQLVAEHGSAMVFVRPPVPRRAAIDRQDRVPEGAVPGVRSLLEQHGHQLVDGAEHTLRGDRFANVRHLTDQGARIFTTQIAPTLLHAWNRDAPGSPPAP